MSPHQILGVVPGASKAAVRKAYLTLAKKFHPDLNPSATAHSQFQKIQEAYNILCNETETGDRNETPKPEYAAPRPTPKPTYRDSAGFPGGADAYWKFQNRTREAEFAREYAEAQDERMRENARNFDRAEFEFKILGEAVQKFLPIFFLPLALLILAFGFGRNSEPPEKFRVFWDTQGRAFAEDAFGQFVRAEAFDNRNK